MFSIPKYLKLCLSKESFPWKNNGQRDVTYWLQWGSSVGQECQTGSVQPWGYMRTERIHFQILNSHTCPFLKLPIREPAFSWFSSFVLLFTLTLSSFYQGAFSHSTSHWTCISLTHENAAIKHSGGGGASCSSRSQTHSLPSRLTEMWFQLYVYFQVFKIIIYNYIHHIFVIYYNNYL